MKTKDKILESGLKLFSKHGYLGATTKEIAKNAGVAEITLFRYFVSKEKLFEEVINTYSFLPTLRGLLPEIAELSYEEGLRVIAERFLNTLMERKDLLRIMHAEIHRYSVTIHRIYHSIIDEILKTLASYFAEMQKKGILRTFDTKLGARAFLGMFFSYFDAENFLLLKKYRRTDTETIIKEFVIIFMKGTRA